MKTYSAIEASGSPREAKDMVKDPWVDVGETTEGARMTEDRRQNLGDSIGWARLLILALGTTFIFAATAVLILLWKGASIAVGHGDPGSIWLSIINNGWAPITVTVCSAAIRTAVSLQAGVVMSMIASVLLEKKSTEFQDVAFLSIVRAVSVQPITILVTGGRGVL